MKVVVKCKDIEEVVKVVEFLYTKEYKLFSGENAPYENPRLIIETRMTSKEKKSHLNVEFCSRSKNSIMLSSNYDEADFVFLNSKTFFNSKISHGCLILNFN